jgi:hypothetical protein
MRPQVKIRKFKMLTRYPHQRSEGTRGKRGWAKSSARNLTVRYNELSDLRYEHTKENECSDGL